MKNLQEKVMKANFGRSFRRWLIAVLCVALLGGGVSAFLLRPQISEAAAAVQQIQMQESQWEQEYRSDRHDKNDREREDREPDEKHDTEGRKDHDKEDLLLASVSRPSTAAFFSVGVTGLLLGLLGIAFWLGTAAWLYQLAALSDMNGMLWAVLGLCGNLFSAALFLVLRGFIRKKCPACSRWQKKGSDYCSACGQKFCTVCPSCGTGSSRENRYCPSCGAKLSGE